VGLCVDFGLLLFKKTIKTLKKHKKDLQAEACAPNIRLRLIAVAAQICL